MRIIWASLAILAATTLTAHGAESVGRSNPLRKVLLDTLRPSIQDDLGKPVQFVVDVLQVDGRWAFMAGTAQNKDGSPIDFSDTRYAEPLAEGMFDGPSIRALMEKSEGTWHVAAYSIGATDVVEGGWPDEFGVPCSVVNFC